MPEASSPMVARGSRIAGLLTGAWRPAPPAAVPEAADLADAAPFLIATGAGALTWYRLRDTPLAREPLAQELRQAYRYHALQAALHQRALQPVVSRLRSFGVEPLLVKGWAVGRLYPEPALRPSSDIDLAVHPDQLALARRVLLQADRSWGSVDLHPGISDINDRSWGDIWARSREVPLGDTAVRVLGPEDQLRHLCLHMLRHGAWRPLWLCDIALVLELSGPALDWECCLAGSRRLRAWVLAALALASALLGAPPAPPLLDGRGHCPAWLRRAVLRQWGEGRPGDSHSRDSRPILDYLARPLGLGHALRCRWPNPIEAAVGMRSTPHGATPRWLLQVLAVLGRASRLALRIPRRLLG